MEMALTLLSGGARLGAEILFPTHLSISPQMLHRDSGGEGGTERQGAGGCQVGGMGMRFAGTCVCTWHVPASILCAHS